MSHRFRANLVDSTISRKIRIQTNRLYRYGRQLGVRCFRTLFKPPYPENENGRLYINLGCGQVSHPSFINIDARPDWHIHYCRRIDKLSPLPDDYADLIYASHCLEHFGHRKILGILSEWRRVLKPDGVLRIAVPDFDQLLTVYEMSGRNLSSVEQYIMGGQDYHLNAHFALFTERNLTLKLFKVGFREVRRWTRGVDELSSLPDCSGASIELHGYAHPISLNLEAVK